MHVSHLVDAVPKLLKLGRTRIDSQACRGVSTTVTWRGSGKVVRRQERQYRPTPPRGWHADTPAPSGRHTLAAGVGFLVWQANNKRFLVWQVSNKRAASNLFDTVPGLQVGVVARPNGTH